MPFLVTYIIKFSISLAVVYLFYQLILRRLTFYNWNRMYLFGYTMMCFFIPFIDISVALQQNKLAESEMINWLPFFQLNSTNVVESSGLSVWNMVSLLMIAGIVFMSIRLVVQLFSFRKLLKNATLISNNGIYLYQVDKEIIPFSFGNAVFINKDLHNELELQEIIRHEIVHVRQRHSFDIILGEIICMVNWFNPFAWFIRKAIRQNLEFIADNKVLDNGVDRKQYQYLLLKVIGNNHFSIAAKFNFSSLKKRIAMMNKLKSTKLNLLRFLFVLPLIAVILVSFRNEIGDSFKGKSTADINAPQVINDTIPLAEAFTDKNYFIYVMEGEKDALVVVKDKNKKEVIRMKMIEWAAKEKYYEGLYGKLPPPPPPPPPPSAPLPPPPPSAPAKNRLDEVVTTLKNNNERISATQYQNNDRNVPNTSSIHINGVNGKTPLIVIDGEIVFQEVMAKLDQETIQSIDVLKDKSATALYGDKGKDGVLIIKTKARGLKESNPLIVLDGKIISQQEMDNLSPHTIESLNVLKGKTATDLYQEKGKDGVIIITTKNKTIRLAS